jgi:hypothetical protein
MVMAISDEDFMAMILGSMPDSYRPLLSSLPAVLMSTQIPLNPNELWIHLMVEYEH